jgi:hypothetical protein
MTRIRSFIMEVRPVKIIVTENVVGTYEARSYPDDQRDKDGYYNVYSVPVYSILVEGLDNHGKSKTMKFIWRANNYSFALYRELSGS